MTSLYGKFNIIDVPKLSQDSLIAASKAGAGSKTEKTPLKTAGSPGGMVASGRSTAETFHHHFLPQGGSEVAAKKKVVAKKKPAAAAKKKKK